jgi:protein-disulfide isomerase
VHWLKRSLFLLLLLSLGCSAQTSTSGSGLSPDAEARIKRLVRNHKHLKEEVTITLGPRKPSQFAGYDELTITMSLGKQSLVEEYYITKDGEKLLQITELKDPMASINTSGRPVRGGNNAKVTMVVYDDFQCPYCRMYYQTLFGTVMKDYGDKVKVVYKDFPLETIHPWAAHAAIDSECLASQNPAAYWDFSDYVHANQQAITSAGGPAERAAALDKLTLDLGQKYKLNDTQLQACVNKQDRTQLDASIKEGDQMDFEGTPAIFVNGQKLEGAIPANVMRKVLDAALTQAGVAPPVHPTTSADTAAGQQPSK